MIIMCLILNMCIGQSKFVYYLGLGILLMQICNKLEFVILCHS
jgi:hypothetical protein